MRLYTVQWYFSPLFKDPLKYKISKHNNKVLSEGFNFDNRFFHLWWERVSKYHLKLAIIGSLAGRWWSNIDAVPYGYLRFVIVVFPDHTHLLLLVVLWFPSGSGPVLLRNPIALYFSRGGGEGAIPTPPPLWTRAWPSCFISPIWASSRESLSSDFKLSKTIVLSWNIEIHIKQLDIILSN